jgi:hypothetical protein
MADAPVVHIGENSPEHVAFALMNKVFAAEGKGGASGKAISRSDILSTYAQCVVVVRSGNYDAPRA